MATGYGWSLRNGDWPRLRQILQKVSKNYLGPESTPQFSGLTVTGDTNITGNVTIGGTMTIAGGVSMGGNLNMNCNEVQNFVVHTVADAVAMQALTCGQGQMCFRQDTDKFYGRLV
ncbi:MAG: hypothetical protein ACYSTZ_00165 [Planctomycetota bacterium]|jgi:hypothetical protein